MTAYAMYVSTLSSIPAVEPTHSGLVVHEAIRSGFHIANRCTVPETMTESSWGWTEEGQEAYEKEMEFASVEKPYGRTGPD